MNVYHHSGDLGDVVAAFPIMQKIGPGKLIISGKYYPPGKGPRESLRGARFESLQPLWQATDYLSGIEWQEEAGGVTHDIGSFRIEAPWHAGNTLTQWQARGMGVELQHPPPVWLKVDAPYHGKIVVNRTARYHTPYFPWRLIVEKYHKDIIFIGLPSEYGAFQQHAGNLLIEYRPTPDLYEAAKLIAGSKMFIGNQSVMFWIAAGLGHPLIQETYHQYYSRDSIVPRDNAMFIQSKADLEEIHKKLEIDDGWLKPFDFVAGAPKVNMSTSAGDIRKNMSTSAEIYQALQNP